MPVYSIVETDCVTERMTMVIGTLLATLFFGIYSVAFVRALIVATAPGSANVNLTLGPDVPIEHVDSTEDESTRSRVLAPIVRLVSSIRSLSPLLLSILLMYTFATVGIVERWFTAGEVFGAHGDRPRMACKTYLGPARWALSATDFELALVLCSLLLTHHVYRTTSRSLKATFVPGVLTLSHFVAMVSELIVLPQTHGWYIGFTVFESSGFMPLSNGSSIATLVLTVCVALSTFMLTRAEKGTSIVLGFLGLALMQIITSTVSETIVGYVFAVVFKFAMNVAPCVMLIMAAGKEGAIQL